MAIHLPFQIATIWMAVHPVLFSRYLHRDNRYARTATLAGAERYMAFGYCKNRMVTAHADIFAWMPLGAALAHNDVTRDDMFATEFLYAQSAACTVTAIA